MDDGSNVQDENLVNDQVAAALNDSGVSADAAQTVVDSGFVPTPTVTPLEDDTPAEASVEAAPEATPVAPAVAAPEAEVAAPTEEAVPEAAPMVASPEATPAKEAETEESPSVTPSPVSPLGSGSGDDDELIDVKQKALEQLSPLVSHLDLPADQKFDTYMEIIRASDDKSLIQPAFEAAQEIEDEDKKAQALLDVVNEVNYLTQDHPASE